MKRTRSNRDGLTLVELVVATGLLSLLMIAVFALLDGTLSMWDRAEVRRELGDRHAGVMDRLADDLRAMESGAHGDVWIDWFDFDTDGDELRETVWPRLRFVRQASAAEIARITANDERPRTHPALIEIVWCVLPDPSAGAEYRSFGVLRRGVRLVGAETQSFLDETYFRTDGEPAPGSTETVTGGVLWFGVLCATQTSIVHDGWTVGEDLEDAATAWDARGGDRLDPTRHPWNVRGAGMPRVEGEALLPRRVRVELTLERESDLRRRTSVLSPIAASDTAIEVDDVLRLPPSGGMVKIDGEWMEVLGRRASLVDVKRGLRGTEATVHAVGATVHFGRDTMREVSVRLYREDWNL